MIEGICYPCSDKMIWLVWQDETHIRNVTCTDIWKLNKIYPLIGKVKYLFETLQDEKLVARLYAYVVQICKYVFQLFMLDNLELACFIILARSVFWL